MPELGCRRPSKVWLNPTNDYMYRHLHVAEERMRTVARMFNRADDLTQRHANQMARELLLAQSSDWAFILTHDTTTEYATRRFKDHINRFTGLFEQLMHGVPQHQTVEKNGVTPFSRNWLPRIRLAVPLRGARA